MVRIEVDLYYNFFFYYNKKNVNLCLNCVHTPKSFLIIIYFSKHDLVLASSHVALSIMKWLWNWIQKDNNEKKSK